MIAIITACGSNFSSIVFALQRLGHDPTLTVDADVIHEASHVILPGVGAAAYAMEQLQQAQLTTVIRQLTQPVLAICLGMQLLFATSAEGNVECLGILPGEVNRLPQHDQLNLPHMGWNQLQLIQPSHPLLVGINNHDYAYFIHSYAAPVSEHTLASTDYGRPFSAIVNKDNFYAAQFHPERSSQLGATIMTNFLAL